MVFRQLPSVHKISWCRGCHLHCTHSMGSFRDTGSSANWFVMMKVSQVSCLNHESHGCIWGIKHRKWIHSSYKSIKLHKNMPKINETPLNIEKGPTFFMMAHCYMCFLKWFFSHAILQYLMLSNNHIYRCTIQHQWFSSQSHIRSISFRVYGDNGAVAELWSKIQYVFKGIRLAEGCQVLWLCYLLTHYHILWIVLYQGSSVNCIWFIDLMHAM